MIFRRRKHKVAADLGMDLNAATRALAAEIKRQNDLSQVAAEGAALRMLTDIYEGRLGRRGDA